MARASEYSLLSKVCYLPIEAAIRWSGLARYERQILDVLKTKIKPEPDDFPKWPTLRLNTERIYDAILNQELPYGIDGVTVHNMSRVKHPHLTIRHVDLKSWMTRYYPDERPEFLFSQIEQRLAHPTITVDAVNALLVERDALKVQIEQRDRELERLRDESSTRLQSESARTCNDDDNNPLSPRAESTYLHIVGGLVSLLLGRAPSGQPYSTFRTQEAIISAMVAHHGQRLGVSQRTLETKFAAAKRALSRD